MNCCINVFLLLCSCLSVLEGSQSFVIQPNFWDYKGHDIGFEVSRRVTASTTNETGYSFDNRDKEEDPVLLLNGFGVGSFHQHRLIPRLFDDESVDSRIVYCVDYLGQGRSWPRDCEDGNSENEKGLIYSAETWIDQIVQFIEEIILPDHPGSKIHLVGNSVGGHLAAYVAARRPDLIQSICLLNPTPVWGLNLPGWSGHLPAPKVPKAIGRYLFDRIRDLNTIDKYLENAYSRRGAFDEELKHQIRGCTLGTGGHAAFASILWSPPLKFSDDGDFQNCLSRVQCDVLLMFGKDDPWCKPAFAKKMLGALDKREPSKVHRYLEVENCGHCPNHEAPSAVAQAVNSWVEAADGSKSSLSLVPSGKQTFVEPWGETAMQEREKDLKNCTPC